MGLKELLDEGDKLSDEAHDQMEEAELLGTLINRADGLKLDSSLVRPLANKVCGFAGSFSLLYEWVNDALEKIREANPDHKGTGGKSHGDE